MAGVLAGTRYRGDFEERMTAVIAAITEDAAHRILFIDEIHNTIGAGAASGGAMDASNMLKPALASGDIKCIGTTTFKEYRTVFEKDHALARRFQKIEVSEPSVDDTVEILNGLQPHYEEFHGVVYAPSSVKSAAELAARYINDRFLPDKAIDVLDEAGAEVKLRAHAASVAAEEANRRQDATRRRSASPAAKDTSPAAKDAKPVTSATTLRSRRARSARRPATAGGREERSRRTETAPANSRTAKTPAGAEDAKPCPEVTPRDVEIMVSRIAKIPTKTVHVDDRKRLATLDRDLKLLIYGQDAAIDKVVHAIRLSRAGLGEPDKPIGSFLFAGPPHRAGRGARRQHHQPGGIHRERAPGRPPPGNGQGGRARRRRRPTRALCRGANPAGAP